MEKDDQNWWKTTFLNKKIVVRKIKKLAHCENLKSASILFLDTVGQKYSKLCEKFIKIRSFILEFSKNLQIYKLKYDLDMLNWETDGWLKV